MISLNHVLTGTAIGLTIKQPLLVAPVAFLSHFLLDAVPHYEYGEFGTRRLVYTWLIDMILSVTALGLIILLAPQSILAVVVGGVFAELADVFWLYYYIRGKPDIWFFRFHLWIQWSETARGLWYELLYLVLIVLVNAALLK